MKLHPLAYCDAAGVIGFGKSCPKGCLPIGRGDPRRIKANARLAYDGQTFLVPGVPEAPHQLDGVDALTRWRKRLLDAGVITFGRR